MDYEQVMNDKKLREQLEGGETITLTMKVIKFTGQNKKLPRVIVITNKNVYNISPAEESTVKSFFQNLVNKSRIKRKIPLSAITSITISKIVKEFILHIPTEYDQRYRADDQLSLIMQTLCDVYIKHNLKKVRCHFIEEMNLNQYIIEPKRNSIFFQGFKSKIVDDISSHHTIQLLNLLMLKLI